MNPYSEMTPFSQDIAYVLLNYVTMPLIISNLVFLLICFFAIARVARALDKLAKKSLN